jgi:biopolymer transport protein ExbB
MDGKDLIAFFTSWNMWVTISPIILCSVISLAVIIERLIFFRRINIDYRLIVENVSGRIRQGDIEGAKLFCGNYYGPIIKIIMDVLSSINSSQDRYGLLLGHSRNAIKSIERNVGVISTIATISPMLGLFGTVTGLLKAFMALYQGGPDASALLAYGVAEALLTTIIGLMVAMPSWVFYNYMVSQVEFYIKEVEYISIMLGKA